MAGDTTTEQLFEALYHELHERAEQLMRHERSDHTLQPTALVSEAYMKLAGDGPKPWRDRLHFVAIAARAMRQVLVDHAKARKTDKRGGGARPVTLEGQSLASRSEPLDVLALDEALSKIAAQSRRAVDVVVLRFFGGMTMAEIATYLDLGERTVDTEWRTARAWLHRELVEG